MAILGSLASFSSGVTRRKVQWLEHPQQEQCEEHCGLTKPDWLMVCRGNNYMLILVAVPCHLPNIQMANVKLFVGFYPGEVVPGGWKTLQRWLMQPIGEPQSPKLEGIPDAGVS